MKKYPIKQQNKDFRVLTSYFNTKGTREKKLVVDNKDNKAFFKYEGKNYDVSEACSEKMCYEIAKLLGYECAKIELARDEKGTLGILNYLFVDNKNTEHIDAVAYINIHDYERSKFYTISNIKVTLDKLDPSLFTGFIRIMLFDTLVGEQDRHEENWGVERINQSDYKISPLYDNGCSLLNKFKNETYANKFYSGIKDFNSYIRKSKTLIYKENHKDLYKHFELIEYLNTHYHEEVQKELKVFKKLTDDKIQIIVEKIPDELLSNMHKLYIVEYLKRRRDILLNIK